MEQYDLQFAPSVRKDLRRLDRQMVPKILLTIEDLRKDPRPAHSKKLTNQELYRIRVGEYRIVYEVEDDHLVVLVVKVAHRKDVYRK